MAHPNMTDLALAGLNTMHGWAFTKTDLKEAFACDRLLNPSIDLGNPCNLNCPYCFVEEKDSERKLKFNDELSLQEQISVIEDFANAGARTVNIVGAGEPTIDPGFEHIIQLIADRHMTPVVFTNGILLAERPHLVDMLYKTGTSIVIKYNSGNTHIQDLVAGRIGYTRLRDKSIEVILNRGFQSHQPTSKLVRYIPYAIIWIHFPKQGFLLL